MRVVPLELDIAPDEGFTPSKDIFGRKDFGEQLARMARRLEGPTVLLLDAPWGMGKTTFVKMWRGLLLKTGVQSIYFDAFANDYHNDAFLALAGEVIARVERETSAKTKALKGFKKTAIGVAKVLGRTALNVGINMGTAGLVDVGTVATGIKTGAAEIAKQLEKGTEKAFGDLIAARLESHASDRRAFDDFRSALTNLVESFPVPDKQTEAPTEKGGTPFIFIIDELDRCRPTFAVALLEKIKHFFSVPGLIFLLVENLSQLEASVRFAYGNIDARTYLEKFYHLRLTLPPRSDPAPDSDIIGVYVRYLFSTMLTGDDEPRLRGNLCELISQLGRIHSLSLRTLQRVCAYTGLFLISTKKSYLRPAPIIAGLSVMKVIDPKLYQTIRTRQIEYSEVESFFQFGNWRDWHDSAKRSNAGEFTEKWWRFVLGAADTETTSQFNRGLIQYNFRDPRDIPKWCCDFIDGATLSEA